MINLEVGKFYATHNLHVFKIVHLDMRGGEYNFQGLFIARDGYHTLIRFREDGACEVPGYTLAKEWQEPKQVKEAPLEQLVIELRERVVGIERRLDAQSEQAKVAPGRCADEVDGVLKYLYGDSTWY